MKIHENWRELGWRHPLWDYVRFYAGLHKGHNYHKEWLAKLKEGVFEISPAPVPIKLKKSTSRQGPDTAAWTGINLPVPPENLKVFLRYIEEREANYGAAASKLRTKAEALAYCEGLKLEVMMTSRTSLPEWQDSPGVLVAAVTRASAHLSVGIKGLRRFGFHEQGQILGFCSGVVSAPGAQCWPLFLAVTPNCRRGLGPFSGFLPNSVKPFPSTRKCALALPAPPAVAGGWSVEAAHLTQDFQLDQRGDRTVLLIRVLNTAETEFGNVKHCEFQVDRG